MAITSCNQAYFDSVKRQRDAKQNQKDTMDNQITALNTLSDQLQCEIDAANQILASIETDTPQFPDILHFTATKHGDSQIDLTWDNNDLGGTYTIQRNDTGTWASPTTVYTGAWVSVFPDTVSGLGVYHYRIKASATGMTDSGWSEITINTMPS